MDSTHVVTANADGDLEMTEHDKNRLRMNVRNQCKIYNVKYLQESDKPAH